MKIINMLIFSSVASVLFYGCYTPLNIEGTYSKQKDVNSFELYSDSTFIYKRTLSYGSSFIDKYSDGKWRRIDKNTIVLNSRIANNIVPVQVEKINTNDTSIQVCTNLIIIQTNGQNEYKTEDFLLTPYIDGNNYLDLHSKLSDEPLQVSIREILGLKPDTINFPEEPYIVRPPVKRGSHCISIEKSFDSLFYEIIKQPKTVSFSTYYTLQTTKIDISAQSGELVKINICLNDSLFSYRIFDNVKLKIKGNKLIFKDSEAKNKKYVFFKGNNVSN